MGLGSSVTLAPDARALEHQLEALYRYLEMSESDFRDLLKRVLAKVEKADYTLQQDPDLSIKGGELKEMEKLIESFEKRSARQSNT